MTDNQNPNDIADNSKEKMIGESLKIYSPNIAFANYERFRLHSRICHEAPQLFIEFIRKFRRSHFLVISHDPLDIRINLRMKDKPALASAAFDLLVELLEG